MMLTACAEPPPTIAVDQTPPPPPPPARQAAVPSGTWLLVDTRADTLTVMKGEKPVEIFDKIAIGSGGVGKKFFRGDPTTPLGKFRIGWINPNSRYTLFFGLDYPNLDYAERAYRAGTIDEMTYWRIRHALEQGQSPPQDTAMGGFIGIHGVGAGDPLVHEANLNWTDGCIALRNDQILRLAHWAGVGTEVVIR